jgi:hypothetical protein
MDARQEKLHQQVKELLKKRKEENDALRKIILAMEIKEMQSKKATKENRPRK